MTRTVACAEFDPKIKLYVFWNGLFALLITVIGIVAVPVWLLGWGQWRSRKYFEHLACRLTERTLEYERGFVFRVEKTIPLDTIQDLTLKEGPLLRAFGLCSLHVETAGQSAPQGSTTADLHGIVNAREFRAAVLAQRDRILTARPGAVGDSPAPAAEAGVLLEIRDSVARIESLLGRRLDRGE